MAWAYTVRVNSVGILVYYNIIIIIMIMCIDKSSAWFIECLYRNDDIIIRVYNIHPSVVGGQVMLYP